jgi:hypothetical protein
MELRLAQCHRVLKDTGSMYLHCDWHANAHLRILMDKLFGDNNFQNEIIWCYHGGGIATRQYKRKHDTIFLYSKTAKYYFNPQIIARAIPKFYSEGVAVKSNGKAMEDWWSDIPARGTATNSPEWIGYPTQKPEALLRRVIEASSNKRDIVMDPFCGCGTTISVAQQLDRRWVGIDVSPTACRMMRDRLVKIGATAKLIGMPIVIDELKAIKPYEFQEWVINRINGEHSAKKSSDMGIDGYTFMRISPVQVKQSENVGRNVVDNFETALRREGKSTGYIVAFSFVKGAYEEVARAKAHDNLDIRLVKVDEIDKCFGQQSAVVV